MAESLVRDRGKDSNPEIHLFSDGAVPDTSEFDNKALPLIYHRVGQGANNLGITALDVRANPEDAVATRHLRERREFFDQHPGNRAGIEVRRHSCRFRGRSKSAGPGLAAGVLASQTNDGVFTVHSTLQDDLAADNEASIVSLLPHTGQGAARHARQRLLEKALRAVPNVELTVAHD